MLSKIVVVVLGVVMVMLTALPAQAGGGAGGGTEFQAFLCYLAAEGDRIDRIVNLVDQFGEKQNVRVERARLLCTPTTGTVVQGELLAPTGGEDHLKCYTSVPLGAPKAEVQVTDGFTTENIVVDKGLYVCVLAGKTLLNGPVQ
jgi:hypothetical protein